MPFNVFDVVMANPLVIIGCEESLDEIVCFWRNAIFTITHLWPFHPQIEDVIEDLLNRIVIEWGHSH